MPSVCAGTAASPCRFGQARSGGPVQVQRSGGRCLFCDLERLDECVHDGRGRTAIRQALQATGVFLKNDEDIFEEALARIGEVIPDFADLEEGARRLVAAGDWSRILAQRRRLRAEPAAEEDAVYRHRVDTDRQRVRHKFFPSKALVILKARKISHSGHSWTNPMSEELNAKIDDKAFNDSGLPAAHVTSTAAAIERWCKEGSWSFCSNCHLLRPRHLKEADVARTAAPCTSTCPSCEKQPAPWVPKVDDVPEPLRNLSRDVAMALRPLDVDC
ncbi:pif1, partial [Symbiodinium pilosum]